MSQARSGHGSDSIRAAISQCRLVRTAGRQFNLAKAAARQHSLVVRVREGPTAGIRPSQVAAKRSLALYKVNLPEPRTKKKKSRCMQLGLHILHSTPAQPELLRIA